MGWERRGQHVSKLVLHAKQVYLMAQGLNPSSSTPSDTFLTNYAHYLVTQPNPRPWGFRGWVKPCCNNFIADNASSMP
jgi:hypothetical protein